MISGSSHLPESSLNLFRVFAGRVAGTLGEGFPRGAMHNAQDRAVEGHGLAGVHFRVLPALHSHRLTAWNIARQPPWPRPAHQCAKHQEGLCFQIPSEGTSRPDARRSGRMGASSSNCIHAFTSIFAPSGLVLAIWQKSNSYFAKAPP